MRPLQIRILSSGLAVLVLLNTLGLHPAASQVGTLYNLVALSTGAGESITYVRDINIAGQIVGRAGHATGSNTRAVLWAIGIAVNNDLGTLPGGDYSGAFGINNLGQVAGTSNTGTVTRAFIWTVVGGMRDLGVLPKDSASEAFGINSSGTVVGSSTGSKGTKAVLWTPNGRISSLGMLRPSDNSKAFAINDSGYVVGASADSSGSRAVLWRPNGVIQDLGTLPGDSSSEALDINNSGQVVGYSSGPNGTRAFLWTAAGGMQSLGTMPGATSSKAYGINNLGQIVGTSVGPAGSRAVIWRTPSVISDLNILISGIIPDAVLVEAHCINDAGLIGAISGGGSHTPGADHDQDSEHLYRAFLLTPIQ